MLRLKSSADGDGDGDVMLASSRLVQPKTRTMAMETLRCWLRYPGLLLRVPRVCVRPVSTEKRRLLLLWLVRGHGAQWWLLVLVSAPGAVQRGWFAGDVASAGWATDAGEETHGFRCTASGAGGGAPCWLLMRAHEIDMAEINGDGDNNLKKVTRREEDDLGQFFFVF
ncbi:hypothetical protein NC651_036250 [Populus alba x Populus x berolinensis]|nr:hypothetical protein NC651_036250 [Populus alba x Populus x berolinensis]